MLYNNSYYNRCYITFNLTLLIYHEKQLNTIGELKYGKCSRIKKRCT